MSADSPGSASAESGRLAWMSAPGKLAFSDYPVPSPEARDLLVRVIRANVCGSELHIWAGKHPVKKRGGLGHELVGAVTALGTDRRTDSAGEPLAIGDRIVATYFQTCHQCPRCRDGQPNLCDNAYEYFARQPEQWPHFHAAFATHWYVHGDQHIYRVPDQVSDAAAAGANCALSQVMFGLDQVRAGVGDSIVIQGAGGLGLYATAVAREHGARVIVIDPVRARLVLAAQFGANGTVELSPDMSNDAIRATVTGLFSGREPDIVIEVTGRPEAFSQGLELVRRGGRYLVMGNVSPGQTVPYDPGLVTRRAVTVHHIDRYDGRYLAKALDFLSRHHNRYPFDSLGDTAFPLDATEQALAASLARTVTRAAIIPAGAAR